MKFPGSLLLLSIILGAFAGTATAQATRAGGGDQALKRAQYMLRMLNEEKSALEAEVARRGDELAALEAEMEKQQARNRDLEERLDQAGTLRDKLMARVRADAKKYRELRDRYQESVRTVKQANADNRFLVEAVREREEWIDTCQGRNDELFAANHDLMERYAAAGFEATEGILGLKRVALENEVQEYRFRIEDLQVTEYRPSADMAPHLRDAGQGMPRSGGVGNLN